MTETRKRAEARRAPKIPPRVPARLLRLTIEDLGLIERAEVDFSTGMTVFSGETGSGKTMVLGALALCLGDRAGGATVRPGAERGRVSLEFAPDTALQQRCDELGFALDPGEDGVIVRELREAGRSSIRVNGRPATAAQLRDLMRGIVEYIGQHEQQRLMQPAEHGMLLDRYAGETALTLRAQTAHAVLEVAALIERYAQIARESEDEQRRRADAQSVLDEFERVAPAEDEDLHLREQHERLRHAERIGGALRTALAAASEDDDSAANRIGETLAALKPLERYGGEFMDICTAATALQSEIHDFGLRLGRVLESASASDDAAIEAAAERIEILERFKRRHGGSLPAAFARVEEARNILDSAATRDDRLRGCAAEMARARDRTRDIAARLTSVRTEAAIRLEAAVDGELRALAMPAAHFRLHFTPLAEVGPAGAERVQFMLAANAGQDIAPLAQSASGGELSRIMLALVVVLAADAGMDCLVFDEIDTGIGGATAAAVGERLARLAAGAQVVCVTHLAQIAAFGNEHFVVRKTVKKAATTVVLQPLRSSDDRVGEIARMLSGETTAVAREHAATLLKTRRGPLPGREDAVH